MKKLTISLGLIGILAVMAALIIAVGSLGHGNDVESMEIDIDLASLGLGDDHAVYKYIFTYDNTGFLMKYQADGSDEWKEYKITSHEYYSVVSPDLSEYENEGYWWYAIVSKKYKDGSTQEYMMNTPHITTLLTPITKRHGIKEPVDMKIKKTRLGVQFLFPYEWPYYYFTHRNDKYYLINVGKFGENHEKQEIAREITEAEFNAAMSIKLPRNDEISRTDFSNYTDRYINNNGHYDESYPFGHEIIRRYNDGYIEYVYTVEELDEVKQLEEIMGTE